MTLHKPYSTPSTSPYHLPSPLYTSRLSHIPFFSPSRITLPSHIDKPLLSVIHQVTFQIHHVLNSSPGTEKALPHFPFTQLIFKPHLAARRIPRRPTPFKLLLILLLQITPLLTPTHTTNTATPCMTPHCPSLHIKP